MKSLLLLVTTIVLTAGPAFADQYLIAASDITIKPYSALTNITDFSVLNEKSPELTKIRCSILHGAFNFERIIKAGSRFSVGELGYVSATSRSLQDLKDELFEDTGLIVGTEINTVGKFASYVAENYGIKVIPGSLYRLAFIITSEKTNTAYQVRCLSRGFRFSVSQAMDSIYLSNILSYEPNL